MSELSNLAAALSAAQSEIEGAIKGNVNPHFRSKYADLGACWEACREPLTKHGLSVIQMPLEADNGMVRLQTRLLHSSGEYIESIMSIPVSKQDAQGYGSAITYARRYALCAFVGIAPLDDDGEASIGRNTQQPAKTDPNTVEAINAIDSMADLQAAYKAMPQDQRRLYSAVFTARKNELAKAA